MGGCYGWLLWVVAMGGCYGWMLIGACNPMACMHARFLVRRYQNALAVAFFLPGVPIAYYGTEQGGCFWTWA